MASNDPKDPPGGKSAADLFPFDEMSTGEASAIIRRANQITGKPDQPVKPREGEVPLKPMTGAQLAFRPSAPPRQPTGTQPAVKPQTGSQPAFKPQTGSQPAFRPSAPLPNASRPQTGTQPAFKPQTGAHAAYVPPTAPPEDAEAPAFDMERLQAQIRSMSLTDSALGHAPGKVKPTKLPSSATEDTFVKQKIREAEKKVPDFSLDDDLG